MSQKRYVIRKYVLAKSIPDAIKQEKKNPVDDCWLDDKQPEQEEKSPLIGFQTEGSEYYYSPVLKKRKKRNGR